mmetsp:Transcript_7465/g.19583  ORF Transcript_7465/g.19583 Transcript_7465/m.19583 type:complete len:118 (+) Transcript_7465:1069-1422(+)
MSERDLLRWEKEIAECMKDEAVPKAAQELADEQQRHQNKKVRDDPLDSFNCTSTCIAASLYSSGTVELIVCFLASTDCMCALIAGISLRKIKASRPKVSFNWAQASLCCIFIRIGPF